MRSCAAWLAAAVLALGPVASQAFGLCDSAEQRVGFYKALGPWKDALEKKRFDEADRHFNFLIDEHAAGRLTDQELHRWFGTFSRSNSGREPLHEDWIRAYPKSAAARLALVYYYVEQGWNARGTEFASKTSDAQMIAMGTFFRSAFQALPAAEALMKRPSLPAALRIGMLGTTGDPGDRMKDAYRAALKAYPESLQVRVEWMMHSAPKWGGSIRQLEDVLVDARSLPAPDRRYLEYLVLQQIGSEHQRMEDFKRAAAAYGKAIPLCPGFDNALTSLIHMHKDQKDFGALVPAVDLYIDRYPRSGWAYTMRAWSYVERKDWPPAYKDYEKAASLGYAEGYEGLAWMTEWGHATKSDYRKAIDLYETAAANGSKTAGAKADKIRKGAGIQMR